MEALAQRYKWIKENWEEDGFGVLALGELALIEGVKCP